PAIRERALVAAGRRLRRDTAGDPDAFPVLVPPAARGPDAAAAALRDAVDRAGCLPRFAGADLPVMAVRVGLPAAGTVTRSSALERVPPAALLDVTDALSDGGPAAGRTPEERLRALARLTRAAQRLHRVDAAIAERVPIDGGGPLGALRASLPRGRAMTVACERDGDSWQEAVLYLPPAASFTTRPARVRVAHVRDQPAAPHLLAPPDGEPVLFLRRDASAAATRTVTIHAAAAIDGALHRAFPDAMPGSVALVGDGGARKPGDHLLRRPSWYRGKPYTRVAQPGERVVVHQQLLNTVGGRPAADAQGGFNKVYFLDLPWRDVVVSVPRRTAKHRGSVLDPRIFVSIDDVHEAAWSQGVPTPPLTAYDQETDSFTVGRVHGRPLNALLRANPGRQPTREQVRDVVALAARIGEVVLDPSLETVPGYPGADAPALREHAGRELLAIHATVAEELGRCAEEGVAEPFRLYTSLFPAEALHRYVRSLWGANRPAPVGLRHGDLHGENMLVPADPAAYDGAPLVAIDWGLARPQTLAFEIGRACHVLSADAGTRRLFEHAVAGAYPPRSPQGRHIASGEFSEELGRWTGYFAMRTALGEILYSAQELARTPAAQYALRAPRIEEALRVRMLRGARLLDPGLPDSGVRRRLARALREMAERYRTLVPLDSEVTWPSSAALPSIHPFGDSPGLRRSPRGPYPGPRSGLPPGPRPGFPPRSRPSR
ncbi:protein kinase family protein, partial [Marinitenerispora sediminis]